MRHTFRSRMQRQIEAAREGSVVVPGEDDVPTMNHELAGTRIEHSEVAMSSTRARSGSVVGPRSATPTASVPALHLTPIGGSSPSADAAVGGDAGDGGGGGGGDGGGGGGGGGVAALGASRNGSPSMVPRLDSIAATGSARVVSPHSMVSPVVRPGAAPTAPLSPGGMLSAAADGGAVASAAGGAAAPASLARDDDDDAMSESSAVLRAPAFVHYPRRSGGVQRGLSTAREGGGEATADAAGAVDATRADASPSPNRLRRAAVTGPVALLASPIATRTAVLACMPRKLHRSASSSGASATLCVSVCVWIVTLVVPCRSSSFADAAGGDDLADGGNIGQLTSPSLLASPMRVSQQPSILSRADALVSMSSEHSGEQEALAPSYPLMQPSSSAPARESLWRRLNTQLSAVESLEALGGKPPAVTLSGAVPVHRSACCRVGAVLIVSHAFSHRPRVRAQHPVPAAAACTYHHQDHREDAGDVDGVDEVCGCTRRHAATVAGCGRTRWRRASSTTS